MDQSFSLSGKVALVTGGTKGIGRGIALALAAAGADILVSSRTADAAMHQAVSKLGRRYQHLAADLTRREDAKQLVPEALSRFGALDIVVNNAGAIRRSSALSMSETDWNEVLEIDLSAAFFICQSAAQHMKTQGGGKIINICSLLSMQGGINVASYAAAKHGLLGLTRALSNEWAAHGINVNAIAPGYIATELTQALQDDKARSTAILERIPAGRWGNPADLGGAAVFLASRAADYIHGVLLPVDGGWMGR